MKAIQVIALEECSNDKTDYQFCLTKYPYTPPLPVLVNLTIYVNSIHGIDDVEKTLTISIEILSYWVDNGIKTSENYRYLNQFVLCFFSPKAKKANKAI